MNATVMQTREKKDGGEVRCFGISHNRLILRPSSKMSSNACDLLRQGFDSKRAVVRQVQGFGGSLYFVVELLHIVN